MSPFAVGLAGGRPVEWDSYRPALGNGYGYTEAMQVFFSFPGKVARPCVAEVFPVRWFKASAPVLRRHSIGKQGRTADVR